MACAAEELHCEKRFGWKCCYYAAGLCVQLLWEQDICGRDLCVSAFSLVCFIWAPAWINVRRLRLKSTPPCTIGISWSILSIRALVSVWKIKTSCAEILALHCQLPKGARSMNFLSGFVILLWHYSSCMFYSARGHNGVHENNMAFAYLSMLLCYRCRNLKEAAAVSFSLSVSFTVCRFVWWVKCKQPNLYMKRVENRAGYLHNDRGLWVQKGSYIKLFLVLFNDPNIH